MEKQKRIVIIAINLLLIFLTNSELYYYMALSLVPGIGPIAGKTLIGYCGGAEAVFTEKKSILSKMPGIGPIGAATISKFKDFDLVDDELKFMEENNIRGIYFQSADYPVRLKQEHDSPLVIYVKGNTDFNHQRIVGIVGTRKNTHYGAEITKKIVEGLSAYNIYTISGMAYGIDICAHKYSIEFGIPSIAVVAHGLDTLYPGQHTSHAKKMIESGGAIVSEHMSKTDLNPDLFPRRNRIVAGMCDALLVVESQKRGGSMITAEIASGYNKDVFAVPGRATDPMSEGCNELIKSLKAALCESALDLANGMNWTTNQSEHEKPNQLMMFQTLTEDEKKLIECLHNKDRQFDDLLFETQIPVNKLSFLLLDMEMKGLLSSLPGKRYCITR